MNRVLAAERNSEAQLVEARTKAEVQRIENAAKADGRRLDAEASAVAKRLAAENDAQAQQIATDAEIRSLKAREEAAAAYTRHPVFLRQLELETLSDLATSANARIYVDFNGHGKDAYADPSA